ncbi:MAG: 7-cyano-7-deazaguanine synthase [Chlamydiae bacterium]|nr:7-cyano-7-deazaguanine synthase [Chlamydiota bacterium]
MIGFNTVTIDDNSKNFYKNFSVLPKEISVADELEGFTRELYKFYSIEPTITLTGASTPYARVELDPNKVLIPFTSGIDSTAAALIAKKDGKEVVLFYIDDLNTNASRERDSVVRIAAKLGLTLVMGKHIRKEEVAVKKELKKHWSIDKSKKRPRGSKKISIKNQKESPVKNQFIHHIALGIMQQYGCGTYLNPGQDENNDTHYSDTVEGCAAFHRYACRLIGDHEVVNPVLKTKEAYIRTLLELGDDEIFKDVNYCLKNNGTITYNRKNSKEENIIKTAIPFSTDNNCNLKSCWKCKEVASLYEKITKGEVAEEKSSDEFKKRKITIDPESAI